MVRVRYRWALRYLSGKDEIAVQDSQTAPTTVAFSEKGKDDTSNDDEGYGDGNYNASNFGGFE